MADPECSAAGKIARSGWRREAAKPVYFNIAGWGAGTLTSGGTNEVRVGLEADVSEVSGLVLTHQALGVSFNFVF